MNLKPLFNPWWRVLDDWYKSEIEDSIKRLERYPYPEVEEA